MSYKPAWFQIAWIILEFHFHAILNIDYHYSVLLNFFIRRKMCYNQKISC